jgi:hypothetical protein
MWRIKNKATSGLTALLLLGLGACVDLEVQNPNEPDAARVFETDQDIESLIAGAWKNVYQVASGFYGPTVMLSNVSFQHQAPWANAGMEYFGRIPRQPILNQAGGRDGNTVWNSWTWCYRAISAVRTGLRSIDDGTTNLGADETRARAYGKLMQGVAHGALAMLYDSAFVYDESMEFEELALVGYQDVATAALGYLDDAIALASGATFTLPDTWMSVNVTAATLVQLAYSFKAQFRANVARTPAERAAVNWTAVESDAANGVTEDWEMNIEWVAWTDDPAWAMFYGGWSMMGNYVLGMADTSGNYQDWVATPTVSKTPFYIFTPDTRFPQGGNATMTDADIETAQLANAGANAVPSGGSFVMNSGSSRIHSRPDRGTWRWSYYDNQTWKDWADDEGPYPYVSVADLFFLRAEAQYRAGNMGTVATMVNSTRTLHGLNATDAAGTNTSCVPRLPNGDCGDLWEMLKWEKRIQAHAIGLFHQGWYYDSRGWGDLMEGSFLQMPVIYTEYQLLGLKPYSFGGVGGTSSAPVGTYGFRDVP